MLARPPHPRPPFGTAFGLVLALCGLFFGGMDAEAASWGASSGVEAESHPHDCKCRERCRGASCCCSPAHGASPARRPRPSPPPPGRSEIGTSPCLIAAPCGDSLPPSQPAPTRGGVPAAQLARDLLWPARSGLLLPPPLSDLPTPGPGALLDEPPEGTALA